MPQATASSNEPEQLPQEDAVQKQGCRQFNTGRKCNRSKKGGVCQFVHDPRLRAEAIKERRAAIKAAKKANHTSTEDIREISNNISTALTLSVHNLKTPTKLAPPALNTSSKAPIQNKPFPLPEGYCQHFVRKDCKLEYCPFIHDHTARREFRRCGNKTGAKKTRKVLTENVPLKENSPPFQSKIDSSPSESSECIVQQIPIISGPTTNFGFQSWDSMTLERWATQNLSPIVVEKYLKSYGTYIKGGNIPLAAIYGTEPKQSKRNRRSALKPLTHFHIFSNLPYELREQIWKYYLDLEEEQCMVALKRRTGRDGTDRVKLKRLSPLPTPLVVSSHLRQVALKRYELTFGTRHHTPQGYFNYQNNRLFICNDGPSDVLESAKALRTNDRKRIRLLALPLRDWLKGSKLDFAKGVAGFTKLRSLHILVGNSKEDEAYTRISAQILEKIQTRVSEAWKANNGLDSPKPKIHMKVIPAFVAKQYKIDGLRW